MKYFILILACLCAMSCSRQTTGIDAFVSQYDQASVRMPGILMPLVKKKLHKAGINVKSIKVLTPEKLQNDSTLLKRYLADLEMLDFKDYSKMVEVKEDDEHIRVFFKKRQGSHSPNRSRHPFYGRPGRRWHTRTPQR